MNKLKQIFCLFHKYNITQRYSKMRKFCGKTVYDVYEIERCSKCGKAKCRGVHWNGKKSYEKCIIYGVSQAKADSLIKCQL